MDGIVPCGGCGATRESERCLGCLHDFTGAKKLKREGPADRAERLMNQIVKTWDPPRFTGSERPEDIAQTSVMLAIAFIMGPQFMPLNLSDNQKAAIDSGLKLFNQVLEGRN